MTCSSATPIKIPDSILKLGRMRQEEKCLTCAAMNDRSIMLLRSSQRTQQEMQMCAVFPLVPRQIICCLLLFCSINSLQVGVFHVSSMLRTEERERRNGCNRGAENGSAGIWRDVRAGMIVKGQREREREERDREREEMLDLDYCHI